MKGVRLGWAQPLTMVSGSLPPPRLAAPAMLGVLLLSWAGACGSAAVTPSAHPSSPTMSPSRGSANTPTGVGETPPAVGSYEAASSPGLTPLGLAEAASSNGSTSAPAVDAGRGLAPSPDFVRPRATASNTAPTASVATTDAELARLLAFGEGALRRDDYTAAVEFFRKARRHAPQNGPAVVGLVAARFGQLALPTEYKGAVGNREVKELLTLLDAAAARDPELGSVYLQRGRLLVVLGQGSEARVSLDKAKALLPGNAEVHSLLAIVELSEGHVLEALQGFARASELEPNDAERLSNWGTALLLHGDIQQAISVFRRAVGLAPNDARARGDLGTALLAIGDVNQAMQHLERACQLAPTKATFMSNLGYAHQLQTDWKSAKHWYDKALAADPKLGSAWINLGTLYAAQQQYDAAEQAFRKALTLNPSDPRAIGNLEDLAVVRASSKRASNKPDAP